MKRVTPEKSGQLTALLADLGVTFHINEETERIRFRADSGSKVIEVGTKCLARLWVHAFAYFTIFTDLVPHKVRDPEAPLDLRSSARLQTAAALLKWAIKADVQIKVGSDKGTHSATLSIPPELEVVFSAAEFARDKRFADEHAFAALAFILHHELAHIRLGHIRERGAFSHDQEKAADRMAAEWLLDSPGLDSEDSLIRRFGIVIALGWLTVLAVYVEPTTTTHPPAWDRLYQTLEQYVEDNIVWAFGALVVGVHLENQRSTCIDPGRGFDSFREGLNHYIDILSRLHDS